MTVGTLEQAEREAQRFLARVQALSNRIAADATCLYGCKESGAVRRASLDLSRALSVLRKPG